MESPEKMIVGRSTLATLRRADTQLAAASRSRLCGDTAGADGDRNSEQGR
eukprot:CAMPEP_0118987222 /NCGR_PEP_ID=MMETSP1173-20130426/43745_1 /TAXON_ID=1034831 /ORGANISM="Rhizochromulina marina cf, Strain CCMP1243" /LENGTH=49 /DNA_ID=CAMNT_0006938055 /DNA_START=62 /DNA_END=211 /DNA_ORIENTATION=-